MRPAFHRYTEKDAGRIIAFEHHCGIQKAFSGFIDGGAGDLRDGSGKSIGFQLKLDVIIIDRNPVGAVMEIRRIIVSQMLPRTPYGRLRGRGLFRNARIC